ncbi:MAG: hypothetical protein GX654_14965 [Desulfatiglans sp.]|mgnify:CR=1 FL=1|nr:hypothetical protein [Desulfatiglans sp.]
MKSIKMFNTGKTIISFTNLILFMTILFTFQVGAITPIVIKEKTVELPAGTDADWWQRVQQKIIKSEYWVAEKNKTDNQGYKTEYHAMNRAHNLRTYFTPDGIRVTPGTDNPDWEWGFSLMGFGLKGDIRPVEPGKISKDMNRVEYQRGENLTEWYINDEKGLEQGFTIEAPFVTHKSGAGNILVLELGIIGNLTGEIDESGDNIKFGKPGEASVVNFGKLYAFDSSGKVLPSEMIILADDLQIQVDTTGAIYPVTIDPLVTTPSWTAESNQADSMFGYSVASAGDVNKDGYSDVIVGAPLYNDGSGNYGGAFVYYGSSSGLSDTPSWTAESDQAFSFFGYSVESAGDVNKDGYSDVIVGAPLYNDGSGNYGGAFVYYGSSSGLSDIPSWTAGSDQDSSWFGSSVASAGDVNKDGYSDVIVGAFSYDNNETDEGRAFVYYGSAAGLSNTPSWTAESNQADAMFGYSVASAGDVNKDGYSDVIVGAPGYDSGETNEGRAFVYYGSASGLSNTPSWTAESNQADSYFGYSVASAGDVNKDGYSDVIVGAYLYDNDETDEGRAFVYYGSSSGLSNTPSWTAESNQAESLFGFSVASAGDVNGDGYSDILVGAPAYNNGEADEGQAFVYYGSPSGLRSIPSWTVDSDQVESRFGYSVASAGDVNGDGCSDVIVGAPYYDSGEADEGRAFVYYSSTSGLSNTPSWTEETDQGSSYFGFSIASAGDVNGDGYSDVIVGAYGYDNDVTHEGRAFVYYGSASGLSNTPSWTAESGQGPPYYDYNYFGSSVASAGDVNGDGYSDVIVGAHGYDNGQTNEGKVFVYYGSSSGLSNMPSWTAESNQAESHFGVSVASAGDVNGDGYSDIIVGAHLYGAYAGRTFVYHGSSSGLSSEPAWIAESDKADAQFGWSVASAGDVNGDGYSDVIVGAYVYDNGQTNEGRAIVYHGSASGLSNTPSWTAESNQAESQFGYSVASAGDVNGDGYSDVIVGVRLYDNVEINEGRVFVYYGSSSGLSNTPAWTAEADQTDARFGNSVASAGDVNKDGYSDIIVGAYFYDNSEIDEGRAFVYYGSSSGLGNTPRWTAESDQANAEFGYSVASAGDVNGDGYSDVIVGARYYDNGQTNEGRAFAYYYIPVDTDGDGLSDEMESAGCSDPFDADTDDDGIIDGVEDANHNGVVDTGETNPCNADSDNDGIQDGTETGVTSGHQTDTSSAFIPDADSSTTTNPLKADNDDDGLKDGEEDVNHNGQVDGGETDPANEDSDNDGMPDGWEVQYNLDPLYNDANEDDDGDGFSNLKEYKRGTNPQDLSSHPSKGMPWLPLLLSD